MWLPKEFMKYICVCVHITGYNIIIQQSQDYSNIQHINIITFSWDWAYS